MHLAHPSIDAATCVLADWLELQALVSCSRGVTRAAVDSIFRFTAEERSVRQERDEEAGEWLDGEITETSLEDRILAVLEEIEWRQKTLGPAYPFRLAKTDKGGHASWVLNRCLPSDAPESAPYLTCLLIVARRRGLLDDERVELLTSHRIGKLFQVCACLAIGGYLGGEVVSFGWPRATGDAFFPALQAAWERVGYYRLVGEYPASAPPSLKDGGIDIIAWKSFADCRPARLIVFGQAASGDDWKGKSALCPSLSLVGIFFVGPRPRAYTQATVIPFLAHQDAADIRTGIEKHVSDRMAYYEQAHGIILDRIRVAECAHKALTHPDIDRAKIDGAERVAELTEWIAALLNPAPPRQGAAA